MISVTRCADIVGLSSREIVLIVEPSATHRRLLRSYLLNMHRGMCAVHNMIVADLRRYVDLGAETRAADLLVVLHLFLSDYGDAERLRWDRCSAPTSDKDGPW